MASSYVGVTYLNDLRFGYVWAVELSFEPPIDIKFSDIAPKQMFKALLLSPVA